MSKRRQAGDIVIKKAGAGFCGEELEIEIVDGAARCMLHCDDPNCQEWANCLVLKDCSYVYHVSECEMSDE